MTQYASVLRASALAAFCLLSARFGFALSHPWINEFHYDNAGADVGEFVEIAGPAGLDLGGYSLTFYNGNGGVKDGSTLLLSGVLGNDSNGFGFLAFDRAGIQNDMDGFALSWGNVVVQFLSYEGEFAAMNGPAAEMVSTDVGVFETGSDLVGFSLQLSGVGTQYSDFVWSSASAETPGAKNGDQSFPSLTQVPTTGGKGGQAVPDATSTVSLLFAGLVGLFAARRVRYRSGR